MYCVLDEVNLGQTVTRQCKALNPAVREGRYQVLRLLDNKKELDGTKALG